ncbi:MAG: VWA domain-containing protein [Vicinamibacterales bacterium]
MGDRRPSRTSRRRTSRSILIVALDVSGSMAPSMPALKQAAKEFLTAIPRANKVTLLAFNDTSFTLARGATEPADRIKAVDGLVSWGGTALYDVLVRGVDMFGAGTGRKALIVFSDGEDYGSGASLEDAEARLQASDVTLYMIGQGKGVALEELKQVMHRLADPTGGRPLFIERTEALRGAFRELLDELSNQYLLSYTPTNTRLDGTMRRIRVEVDGPYRVRAREGYRAPTEEPHD